MRIELILALVSAATIGRASARGFILILPSASAGGFVPVGVVLGMSDDEQQSRVQDFGADIDVSDQDAPAVCERCGDEIEDTKTWYESAEEQRAGVVDVHRSSEERSICSDCGQLEHYLQSRYHELVSDSWVSTAVAVFCECQESEEVDVQPVRRGESVGDVACSRCGSREVVIEELPPSGPGVSCR